MITVLFGHFRAYFGSLVSEHVIERTDIWRLLEDEVLDLEIIHIV